MRDILKSGIFKHPITATVLGSGSGIPTAKRSSPSIYLTCEDTNVLLDCGEGASYRMFANNIGVSKLNLVLISHMHADHIGGFLQLVQTWQIGQWEGYTPKGYSPAVVVPQEGVMALRSMLNSAYLMPENLAPMTVRFYGVPPSGGKGVVYEDEALHVTAIPNNHLAHMWERHPSLRESYPFLGCQAFSYAIKFIREGVRVVYSGDIAYLAELEELVAEETDLLVIEAAHVDAHDLHYAFDLWSKTVHSVLINHIGPAYDDGHGLREALDDMHAPAVHIGHDGLRVTIDGR